MIYHLRMTCALYIVLLRMSSLGNKITTVKVTPINDEILLQTKILKAKLIRS